MRKNLFCFFCLTLFIVSLTNGQSLAEKYYPQGNWTTNQEGIDHIGIIKHFGNTLSENSLRVTFYYKNGATENREYKYGKVAGFYFYIYYKDGQKIYRDLQVWRTNQIDETEIISDNNGNNKRKTFTWTKSK